MTRVLVLVAPGESELAGLGGLPGEVEVQTVSAEADLREALPHADVLVVTDFRTGLLERCWPAEPKVKWVHATSAGVDALLFPALAESDIPITNAKGIFDRGIAEYVLGAVLLFAKDTMGNLALQREHRWQHRDTEMIDQRRALIVGAGSIGGEVARLLKAVGMQVTGIARRAREDVNFDVVLGNDCLFDCLSVADYVVITAPLTEDTQGLFDDRAFAAMKSGARLINVGRGPIVQTEALLASLQSGHLAGAALDVFEQEPVPEDHPLWEQPNVMMSAHMAGDFIGWQTALGEQFVANFRGWQQGQALFNQVKK
ncbi:D-2-hydroxyacid dehydrogenase [Halopseudomonas pelagia]|uniref:Hydroxyacid dehydrogenase n=1 Tax=Halopseudomonas pelagia TaxID=553151 RepID=A0AA91U017_9GAMM|nr:D-2-hydroxyacid dehydrogenase [Halopseudomonas pelagia]PCC97926.1 hydroxyacid dehydrogenase [Halopseudomonas pelagia]QFY55977.1 D-2-hydroxyacid dehydrogenase [Halopseudomonas pelagia]